jgi:hypothetical protein
MKFADLSSLKSDSENLYLADKVIAESNGCLVINGVVAFPVLTSLAYERVKDIEIKISDASIIGKIKFLKTGEVIEDIFSLPDEEFICFLSEYEQSSIVDKRYKFMNDFLLIEEKYLADYMTKFKESSPIWGSYFHVESQPKIIFSKKLNTNSFEAIEGIEITNSVYFDNLFLAISEANPFNRILKLYHLLELQFDMHTAFLIKGLYEQGGKEREISNKLKDYTRDEDDRLESLIRERCKDLNRLIPVLNNVSRFKSEAITIFYDYGKIKNPLKRADFSTLIGKVDGFTKVNIDALGGYSFDSLLPKLASYWIYRIRCCVAHNRFGEYVMTHTDEKFVVEFGEVLLKEIIIQCFKK